MKRLIPSLLIALIGCCTAVAAPRMSILDIKHSITDDNVVPPESFETRSLELEENFYLRNFTEKASNIDTTLAQVGTPAEYADLLSRLPAEIELPYNAIVGRLIDMYLTRRRTLVADMVALHNYYGNIFVEELIKEKMPVELQYLPVIESALNPNAVSKAGAVGLWQFMPATANGLGMEVNSLVDQRRDPRKSSRAAAKYLKQLFEIYGDWSLAIAAYNCGPGNVNKALRRAGGGKKDFWEIYNYLPSETRGYVPAFIAANFVMNYFDRYGVKPTIVTRQLVTDTVQVAQRVHFNQIAEVLNIPVDEIRMLNPQFRKDIIPGNNHPYALVLPSQQCLSYIMSENAILALDSDVYARRTVVEPGQPRAAADSTLIGDHLVVKKHTVKRGENLRDIAKQFGVSATDIMKWNKLTRGKVKAGDVLTIEVMEHGSVTDTVTQQLDSIRPMAETPSPAVSETRQEKPASKPAAEKKPEAKPKAPTPTTYTVRSGDTLSKIAKKFGVSVSQLQKANNLGSSTNIKISQKLKIPAKAQTTPAKKSTSRKKR